MLSNIEPARPSHRGETRKAFTLIEVLIAIVVLAILAAILFPMFGRSRESSNQSTCQSNLKQIGLAIAQYLQDSDQKFPLAVTGSGSTTSNPPIGWADSIQPYVKSLQVYQCPSDSLEARPNPTMAGYTDYWYNCNLSSPGDAVAPNNVAVSIASVAKLNLTIMVGDGESIKGVASYRCNGNASVNEADYKDVTKPVTSPATGLANTTAVVNRHMEGLNLLYTDGHAKWMKSNTSGARGNLYKAPTTFDISGSAPTFRVRQ